MKNKAVIFDMDGVICDTNPTHSLAFKAFFAKRNLFPSDEELALHMFGKSNRYILKHFFKRDIPNDEFKALEFEKESLFREMYANIVKPIDGFLEFLALLKANGFQTGVATSAPQANLDLIMEKLNFEKDMESILASENVTLHKPDPEVYLKSAQNLNVPIENCIVFEDSYSGIMAAKNAKMKVVGVLSSHSIEELPLCNFYIHNFTEINAEILQDILAQKPLL